jgi:hypothetical protein
LDEVVVDVSRGKEGIRTVKQPSAERNGDHEETPWAGRGPARGKATNQPKIR